MTDKKTKLEVPELNEVQLTKEEKDELFPNRLKGSNRIFEILLSTKLVGFLCIDKINEIANLHLYLLEKARNISVVNSLQTGLQSWLHPWCHKNGFSKIMVSCSADDMSTSNLIRKFGFNLMTVNICITDVEV